MGQCTVCLRPNLSLVWASNKHFTTTVRAHYPKRATLGPVPAQWCPGSGRPPKGNQ
jgi:hypothetical protein